MARKGWLELKEKQANVLKVIQKAGSEGIAPKDITGELGITTLEMNPSLRYLSQHDIIEKDKENQLWFLRDDVTVEEEEGTIYVLIPTGGAEVFGQARAGESTVADLEGLKRPQKEGPSGDYSSAAEMISFEGLDGLDKLKRNALVEWLTTYGVGRKARDVVIKQFDAQPSVKYTREGLYNSLRGAGVREEHAIGILQAVFNIEDEYVFSLSEGDRDDLLHRKSPSIHDKKSGSWKAFDEPLLWHGKGRVGAGVGYGVTGSEEDLSPLSIRRMIRDELTHTLKTQDIGGSAGAVQGAKDAGGQFLLVEEPIIDQKTGKPIRDEKGAIMYRRRWERQGDPRDRALEELQEAYKTLSHGFEEYKRTAEKLELEGKIEYLSGKVDALEKNPPQMSDTVHLEIERLGKASQTLGQVVNNATLLYLASQGQLEDKEMLYTLGLLKASNGEGGAYSRKRLSDDELEDLQAFLAAREDKRAKEKRSEPPST